MNGLQEVEEGGISWESDRTHIARLPYARTEGGMRRKALTHVLSAPERPLLFLLNRPGDR